MRKMGLIDQIQRSKSAAELWETPEEELWTWTGPGWRCRDVAPYHILTPKDKKERERKSQEPGIRSSLREKWRTGISSVHLDCETSSMMWMTWKQKIFLKNISKPPQQQHKIRHAVALKCLSLIQSSQIFDKVLVLYSWKGESHQQKEYVWPRIWTAQHTF